MQTKIGNMDGNRWDTLCTQILRIKYRNGHNFQRIPDRFRGDYGIEGFTYSGIVFQYYCPNFDLTARELYEHQRDKITTDISKFIKNQEDLVYILDPSIIQVKEWQFITPKYEHRDLIKHINKKTRLVRSKNLSYVDKDFIITIKVEDDFLLELGQLIQNNEALFFPEILEPDESMISKWREDNDVYFENADRKLKIAYQDISKVDKIVQEHIKCFIIGDRIIEDLSRTAPNLYERLMSMKSSTERELVIFPTESIDISPSRFLIKKYYDFNDELMKIFSKVIDPGIIKSISAWTISDWLCRCSIEFIRE